MEKMIDLGMTTLALTGSSLLRGEFKRALVNCEGGFIPKPQSMSQIEKMRRGMVSALRQSNQSLRGGIIQRCEDFLNVAEGDIDQLQAMDLAVKSYIIENKLRLGGATYGEQAFNFCVSDLRLPKALLLDIEQSALKGFNILTQCNGVYDSLSPIEKNIEEAKLQSNGARVDIVLTKEGPKIIEVNMQWVDAIQALATLQETYLGQPRKPSPISLLLQMFKGRRRIAILNLSKGAGSREGGAKKELDELAENLYTNSTLQEVEVLDPKKTLPSYIETFDGYYINGEPRMIQGESVPPWMEIITSKIQRNFAVQFPIWRPSLDKKTVLIEASRVSPLFTLTLPYSADNIEMLKESSPGVVLKGDGYSSKSVAVLGTTNFDGLIEDAKLFPEEFVVQPFLPSITADPLFVFDTSSNKPKFLRNPKVKFNVWIINNQVAGTMASVSNGFIISDKDYNVIPKPI